MTEHEERQLERLGHLVTVLLERTITPAETQELEELLSGSQSAQHRYVELMQDINSLRWWSEPACPLPALGREENTLSLPGYRRSRRTMLAVATALAACLALVVGVIVGPQRGGNAVAQKEGNDLPLLQPLAPETMAGVPLASSVEHKLTGVATVLRSKGARWQSGSAPLKEMSRLPVGRIVEFAEGEVEIAFDRAVHMVVRGPARFEIRSALEVYSQFGTLSARVGELGKGFVIETPAGRITDLGTEFGVAIDREGKTDVAVFRGAVDLTYGDRQSPIKPSIARTLTQGQALTLNPDGEMQPLLAIDNGRFPNLRALVPPPPPVRSTIFGEIADNRSGLDITFYRIVPGGLAEDVLAYVDRQHEWNGVDERGIPEPLRGADYIMPFNADKYLPDLEVSIEILRPAILYVFLSSKANEPEWLKELCTKTDMVIGLDESGEYSRAGYELAVGPGQGVDTVFSVWERKITEPGTIKFGSVKQKLPGWGFCMYGLAAVPLENP